MKRRDVLKGIAVGATIAYVPFPAEAEDFNWVEIRGTTTWHPKNMGDRLTQHMDFSKAKTLTHNEEDWFLPKS